jgi:hypothetical protein
VKAFPDTTTVKPENRRRLGPVLGAVCSGVLLLAAVAFLWPADFSPGEEMVSRGAEDIAVSREDVTYPSSDSLRFGGSPEVVYVYMRVEDLDSRGDFGAAVGRTARTSIAGRLLGGGGLRVVDSSGEPLRVSDEGGSGVVKFAVRPESGERLPAGDYTVEVYTATSGSQRSSVVARKYFVVGR